MGKKELNPVERFRKDKKKQTYEKAEKERKSTRKEMSKKIDTDKLNQRLAYLEKEEQAGNLTIGMRKEKNDISSKLRAVSKKKVETDFKFMPKLTANEMRGAKGKIDLVSDKKEDPVMLPDLHNTASFPPSVDTILTAPTVPLPPVPIYNPFAKKTELVSVVPMEITPSFVPAALKRRTMEKNQLNKGIIFEKNPFASSTPLSVSTPPPVEDKSIVPGPKLRFTLVPYGDDNSSDEESEEVEEKPIQEDPDLMQFINEIASL